MPGRRKTNRKASTRSRSNSNSSSNNDDNNSNNISRRSGGSRRDDGQGDEQPPSPPASAAGLLESLEGRKRKHHDDDDNNDNDDYDDDDDDVDFNDDDFDEQDDDGFDNEDEEQDDDEDDEEGTSTSSNVAVAESVPSNGRIKRHSHPKRRNERQRQHEEEEDNGSNHGGMVGILMDMLRSGAAGGRRGRHPNNPENVDSPYRRHYRGGGRAEDDDHNNNNDQEEEEIDIDVNNVQFVLDAAAGNLALAEQLFWDNYRVSHRNKSKTNNKKKKQKKSKKQKQRNNSSSNAGGGNDDDVLLDDDDDNNNVWDDSYRRSFVKPSQRSSSSSTNKKTKKRRSGTSGSSSHNNNVVSGSKRIRFAASDAATSREESELTKKIKDIAESINRERFAKKRAAKKKKDDGDNKNDSNDDDHIFAFDDDEGGGDYDDKRRRRRRQQEQEAAVEEESDDDPEDYISDDDWLYDDPGIPDILWSAQQRETPVEDTDDVVPLRPGSSSADSDGDTITGIIPKTWLNSGFSLSECTNGLSVSPPDIDCIERMIWKTYRREESEMRTEWPRPYHCKSVTAIFSIVTALLYTGCSIQGDAVSCKTSRKSWVELTPEDRKREFDGRLTDALSSLIFVAADASLRRKKKSLAGAMKKMKDGGSNSSGLPRHVLHRLNSEEVLLMKKRMELIPVCRWDERNKIDTDPRGPRDGLFGDRKELKITTSFTNIHEIKSHVRDQLRSFQQPGGVALLIESIIRIHGNGVIARQFAMSRTAASSSACASSSAEGEDHDGLIRCMCDTKQSILNEGKPLPANARTDATRFLDLTPEGTDCVSTELVTLLLTGRMHPNLEDCIPAGLGFGLLTNDVSDVSLSLSRPDAPVWVLRGDTRFSVLCLKKIAGDDGADFNTISKVDQPGVTLDMFHWNCWYDNDQNTSELRIITARKEWVPPTTKSKLALWNKRNADGPVALTNFRREGVIDLLSVEEHQRMVEEEKSEAISSQEMDRVKYHPEDAKLYAGKYHLYRYDMGDTVDNENTDNRSNNVSSSSWKPYFRLSDRQKRIVELKMGPKIDAILQTRWPGSKIIPHYEQQPLV